MPIAKNNIQLLLLGAVFHSIHYFRAGKDVKIADQNFHFSETKKSKFTPSKDELD